MCRRYLVRPCRLWLQKRCDQQGGLWRDRLRPAHLPQLSMSAAQRYRFCLRLRRRSLSTALWAEMFPRS
jgi:hypothetical protein